MPRLFPAHPPGCTCHLRWSIPNHRYISISTQCREIFEFSSRLLRDGHMYIVSCGMVSSRCVARRVTCTGCSVSTRPHCSDVAQTLAIVATQADSPTRVTGIGFIRAKETDRIAAVVTELRRLGIDATEEPDGFVVRPGSGAPNPCVVSTYDDHRMAMSFALLGLRYPGITIADPKCVAKTYPSFWHDLGQVR